MTDQLKLDITFNGPFRIGSGHAGNMLDDVLDAERLLPGASLKGVMREAARLVRPRVAADVDDALVGEVFGTPRRPSPWHWDDAEFPAPPVISARARIALDKRRRTQPGALLVAEEAHTRSAQTVVWQQRPVAADRLGLHLALLNLAARLVEGLGADRRRGLGWVTISTDRTDCATDIKVLMAEPTGAAS